MAKRGRPNVRKPLIQKIRENFAEINVEYLLAKDYMKGTLETYRLSFAKLTNTKNVGQIRTGNLSRFNISRLEDILQYQKRFLNDPYARSKERKKIFKKAKETLGQTYSGITEKQYMKVIDVFNDGVYRMLNLYGVISSDQIVDIFVGRKTRAKSVEHVLADVAERMVEGDLKESNMHDIREALMKEIKNNFG